MDIKVEWGNAPDFAELAETLGINTVDIMAARKEGERWVVIYTTDEEPSDDSTISVAYLVRDVEQILRIDRAIKSRITWAMIEAEVDKNMIERFGEEL